VLFFSWRGGRVATSAGGYWRTALGNDDRKVTIWLRSGTKVTGVVKKWYPDDGQHGKDRAGTLIHAVLRLEGMTLTRQGSDEETADLEFMLVSINDIELIAKARVSPDPSAAVANQAELAGGQQSPGVT
jgi:hypothetical protein